MGWLAQAARRANESIADEGRRRSIRTLDRGGPVTKLGDRDVVQFASNDYLGMATDPTVAAAAARAAREVGTGAGASRLVVGGRAVHDELEAALADWKGSHLGDGEAGGAAVLFPTGYAANLGALAAVVAAGGPGDTVVLSDELNHASLIDGIRLSRAEVAVYPHGDLDAVSALLADNAGRRAVVVTDQVFSMDGDVADLDALRELARAHGAAVVVDVAHDVFDSATDALTAGDGVTGGSLSDGGPDGSDVVVVGTLSKALGSLGGFVVAARPVVDLVVNTARSFIFTTAPSPPDCAAALAALELLRGEQGRSRRARLRANIDVLAPGHPSPVVPVVLGSEQRAVAVSEALLERGLLVPAIRPPTVAPGTSRLRVALSSEHTPGQVTALRDALGDLGVDLHG